jgi:ubiquinone/menaquinone biosynthesis C-methylase UbiE
MNQAAGQEERIRRTYDAVAAVYDDELRDELDAKPFDRNLLATVSELSNGGVLADVGCGPGHITDFLARSHPEVIGIDLSPEMINIARTANPGLSFEVASMLDLPVADRAWTGIVAMYSIIHLNQDERRRAFAEFHRVVRPGGWLLVSFHIDSSDFPSGSTNHLTQWFGAEVDLEGYFLDDGAVADEVQEAGWQLVLHTVRQPMSAAEFPSRRCYLLAQRS